MARSISIAVSQLRPASAACEASRTPGALGATSAPAAVRSELRGRWRLIDLCRRSLFVSGRTRVVVRIDGDRLRSGGRQPKGVELPVLLVAPPDRHSRLGLDLLDEASRDQLRRDLMRRAAFQLFGQRQAVIVPLRGSAQHDELRVRKFDGHGNRPFTVTRPSQSRPLTDASPGSRDRPGLRVVRRKLNRRGPTHSCSHSKGTPVISARLGRQSQQNSAPLILMVSNSASIGFARSPHLLLQHDP